MEKNLKVIIDTPKWSFVKRDDDGGIDYISPFPCPFNYGNVPDTVSADGDRLDVVVLGKQLPRGAHSDNVPVVGLVVFWDNGEYDPKYICSDGPLSMMDRLTIRAFFTFYGFAKSVLNRLRGKRGTTRFYKLREC